MTISCLTFSVCCQFPIHPDLVSIGSTEDFVIETSREIDPYNEALQFYQGATIEKHERLKEVLMRLNPRDYLDWDVSDFDINKRFDDPDSSSSI